ncbi:pEARLI1-like lipid transfer protein 2 [Linum perenne]
MKNLNPCNSPIILTTLPFLLLIILLSSNVATIALAQEDPGTGGGGGQGGNLPGTGGGGGGEGGNLPIIRRRCSIDLYRLAVCMPLVTVDVGSLTSRPCCQTLLGLVDMEVTVCLCLALRANVLGIHIDVPVALSMVLSTCYSNLPSYYFECH